MKDDAVFDAVLNNQDTELYLAIQRDDIFVFEEFFYKKINSFKKRRECVLLGLYVGSVNQSRKIIDVICSRLRAYVKEQELRKAQEVAANLKLDYIIGRIEWWLQPHHKASFLKDD